MKRKTILVYALLSMLITATAGTGFGGLVSANFVSPYFYNPSPNPITDKPTVILQSPMMSPNGTVLTNRSLAVNFTVTMPAAWKWRDPSFTGDIPAIFDGTITSVNCTVDQTAVLSNNTILGRGADGFDAWHADSYQMTYQYTAAANEFPNGQHNITISVAACTYYVGAVDKDEHIHQYDASTNATYTFMLEAPPTVTLLSIENETYTATELPLVFNVNQHTSWMGYSLDNQPNITANGNLTLTGLGEGNHSIVVYANNTYDIFGKSEMASFSIDTTPPMISSLAIENKTYSKSDVPLTFNTNESTSWLAYSLDNQINETVNGNFTLIGLSDGTHSLVIYANDSFGNMGKSDAVFFSVNTQPSLSLILGIVAVVFVAVAAPIIYLRRRKREQ